MENRKTTYYLEDEVYFNELLHSKRKNYDLIINLLNQIIKTSNFRWERGNVEGVNELLLEEVNKEDLKKFIKDKEEDLFPIKTFYNNEDIYRIRVCLRKDCFGLTYFSIEEDELD